MQAQLKPHRHRVSRSRQLPSRARRRRTSPPAGTSCRSPRSTAARRSATTPGICSAGSRGSNSIVLQQAWRVSRIQQAEALVAAARQCRRPGRRAHPTSGVAEPGCSSDLPYVLVNHRNSRDALATVEEKGFRPEQADEPPGFPHRLVRPLSRGVRGVPAHGIERITARPPRLLAVPTLFGVAILVFAIGRVLPGDPALAALGLMRQREQRDGRIRRPGPRASGPARASDRAGADAFLHLSRHALTGDLRRLLSAAAIGRRPDRHRRCRARWS